METHTPLVSFVLATMNRSEDLRKCLNSIFAQSYPRMEVLVVDNASTDDTAEMVKLEFPQVQLINLPENKGAGGGKSVALSAACGEYIVQLDDDETLPQSDVGQRVVECFRANPEVGVLSFNILDTHTGLTAQRTVPRRDKRVQAEDSECGYFLGGGCAFRKEVVGEVGIYWDQLNPYGSEEFDLSLRILQAGYQILWTESIYIYHYESPSARPSWRRTYSETRNRPWVALRHLPWVYVLSHFVCWWGYGALLAARSREWGAYLKGLKDCMAGVPKVYRSRKVVGRSVIKTLRRCSGPLYY